MTIYQLGLRKFQNNGLLFWSARIRVDANVRSVLYRLRKLFELKFRKMNQKHAYLCVVLYFVIHEIKLLNSNSNGLIELYAQNFRKIRQVLRQVLIGLKSSYLA